MEENARRNKVGSSVTVHNEDAAELVRRLAAEPVPEPFTQLVANLPASSLELIPALEGAFPRGIWGPGGTPLPVAHLYAFSKADDQSADVAARVAAYLRLDSPPPDLRVAFVRLVAPGKHMLRCSFRVPERFGLKKQPGIVERTA